MSEYTDIADQALRNSNPRYQYFVDMNKIGKVEVGNLQYGTNKDWMKKKIANGAPTIQVKPIRILDTEEKEEFFLDKVIK